jgi:hypothetical protein
MWNEIAAWQEVLTQRPDLSAKTMTPSRELCKERSLFDPTIGMSPTWQG